MSGCASCRNQRGRGCSGSISPQGVVQNPGHLVQDPAVTRRGYAGRMRLLMSVSAVGEFIKVADFRAALQHFLRESERITKGCGLTPKRYLLLLMIKGAPDRRQRSTVTE